MDILRSDNDWYWYWFVNIRGVGNKTRNELLIRYGHPSEVFKAKEEELSDIIDKSVREAFRTSKDRSRHIKKLKLLYESGTKFIHWESDAFPERLKYIFMPPHALYVRGSLPDPARPSVAMVGSRKATNYGKSCAYRFAKEMAEEGIQIISGLAAGIDTGSHRGALAAGGYTAGILGGGIDTVYPRNNFNLYYDMYRLGGVISEYNMGIPNHCGLFPWRNRIISGLSDIVFVLEAGEKSGSLITASSGLEQGKDVVALPGRITDPMSRGCNRLIGEGAIPVCDTEDILGILRDRGYVFSDVDRHEEGSVRNFMHKNMHNDHCLCTEKERHVLEQMDEINAVSFDQLAEKCTMSTEELEKILLYLEMKHRITQPFQGLYQKRVK